MRWDGLFSDLAGEVEALERQERDLDIADRTRAELGAVSWLDRCAESEVALRVAGLGVLRGQVDTVAGAWLLLHADEPVDWVVAIAAVTGVLDASPRSVRADARGEVARRMTWVNAWSVLSRDRDHVHVFRTDQTSVSGVPVRVGHDFVELATDGGRAELVPYQAIAAVRCPR